MQMIMRIIKYILTRLKMLLDRFILNSDYDTQKELNVITIQQTLTARNMPGSGSGRLVNLKKTSDEISETSFEFPVILCDYFPNIGLVGDDTIYDTGEIEFSFFLQKDVTGKYSFWARILNYSGHNVQVPDITFTARVHQFIPSTQE